MSGPRRVPDREGKKEPELGTVALSTKGSPSGHPAPPLTETHIQTSLLSEASRFLAFPSPGGWPSPEKATQSHRSPSSTRALGPSCSGLLGSLGLGCYRCTGLAHTHQLPEPAPPPPPPAV